MNLLRKHRIYPSRSTKKLINKQEGCNRFVWNETLAHMLRSESWLSYNEMCEFLSHTLKPLFPFLYEVSAQSLQQSIKDLDRAIKNHLRKNQPTNPPKFKKRSWRKSCRFVQDVVVDRTKGFLYLPKMRNNPIKLILERDLPEFTVCTIVKESDDRYYAFFVIEVSALKSAVTKDSKHLGVDLGLKSIVCLSTGEKIAAPKFLRKAEERIIRGQRGLSKKSKGSRAYKKFQKKVARAYSKSKRQRHDWIHKFTTKIANDNNFQAVSMETLLVGHLVKNRTLSKSILDASWGLIKDQFIYKMELKGKVLNLISRFYPSTRTCSNCQDLTGPRGRENLSAREWICSTCGVAHDRDVNAAINIAQQADWIYFGIPRAA